MTSTTKKVLVGVAIVLILVLAGGVWWFSHSLDSLVASAIRTFGPEITGVSIRLDGVTIEAMDGRAALHGLVVGNPPGFSTDHALSLGEISMTIDLDSLTRDVIVIKQVSIVKPDVTYELGPGGSNLDTIQRNVDRYVTQHGGANEHTERNGGKKLVIEDLYIKNATAHVSTAVMQRSGMSVPVPDLHLRDIGKRSGGATAGEVVKQVLGALTHGVTRTIASRGLGGTIDTLKEGTGSALDAVR